MSKSDLDYAAFLSSSFEPREYAQTLLNGSATSSNAISASLSLSHLDQRTIDALGQLGLVSSAVLSAHQAAAAATAKTNDEEPANNGKGRRISGSSTQQKQRSTINDDDGGHGTRSNGIGGAGTTDAFTSAFARAGSGDVSAALSKLSFAAEDLNRQLRTEINTHHSALLVQAGSLSSLEDNLRQIRGGLGEVESSVDRLRRKIAAPYVTLSTSLEKLPKLQRASDLARRAGRFVTLARRLDVQMTELNAANSRAMDSSSGRTSSRRQAANGAAGGTLDNEAGERALSEAALTLAELDSLLADKAGSESDAPPSFTRPASIRSIAAIEHHIPAVQANRARVLNEMEVMIRRGLQELDQPLLASSLQTAYNLSVLPDVVASLVQDLIDAIESRIRNAFDVNALARDAMTRAGEPVQQLNNPASSVFYKSRARTEPTSSNLVHFQAALWSRLEGLIEDMAGCCIKVYVLERVLVLKRDSARQRSFLDEALTTLDNKPTFTFWTTLSQSFESQAREAARSSQFVQQTLSTSYPRLLRLFHEFFSKIALQSDTVYSAQHQSPETILILRSISGFESMYLSRCATRMNENINTAFSGGQRSPPGAQEGLTAARVISNELDAARFDPLLVKNVARHVGKAIDMFVDRIDLAVATDYTATSTVGPLATASQQINAELATALYHLWSPLSKVLLSYPSNIQDALRPNVANARQELNGIVSPLIVAVRREIAAIIARIHRTGFNKPMDPTSTSVYMQDLSDKLSYIRRQILANIRAGEMMKEIVLELCKFTLSRFVTHASIVHPLGEGGKLKLTTDCTTLEFAISQVLGDYKLSLSALGDDFRALRAFRPMLFLETSNLADPEKTSGIPIQILLHHLIVRSGGQVPLPHQVHNWQETEYAKFVSEHSSLDNIRLIEAIVKEWEAKIGKSEDGPSLSSTKDGDEGGSGNAEETRACLAIARQIIDREKPKLRQVAVV